MSQQEIDDYLDKLDEPKRGTLRALRETIRAVIPQAEEGISYGMPAFRLHGKVVAGFAAFKNHLTYVPHSGSVLGQLPKELKAYSTTKSAVHFAIDKPLPKTLVKKLIAVRLKEIPRQ
ncbi:MAG TPA: DUF1801 domain-containing protein [Pirellulales bacterium]|nr:DUF1801 domain-containing protein [Pirellulales bacterium]